MGALLQKLTCLLQLTLNNDRKKLLKCPLRRLNDIQHKDTEHNDTLRNDIQHKNK